MKCVKCSNLTYACVVECFCKETTLNCMSQLWSALMLKKLLTNQFKRGELKITQLYHTKY